MTTWKVGDSWVTFGSGRTVGIGVDKAASKAEVKPPTKRNKKRRK